MGEVQCKRCGSTGAALSASPLPGEAGQLVHGGTCAACWELWKGEQVKLINENQLSPVNPDHYEYLVGQMKQFLGLSGPEL